MNSFNCIQSVISNTSTLISNRATITTNPSISRSENGSYWVYTFLENGTMQFSQVQGTVPLSVLAVGGGGGGGGLQGLAYHSGGGGAGQVLQNYINITSL